MKVILPALAASFIASAGIAQDISVTPLIPVLGQPVLDFRIENCTGEVGFGLMVYGTVATAHHLTDLCFIKGTGLVVTGEVVRGLTQTTDGPNGRRFEDLSMGSDQFNRNSLTFLPDENTPGCSDEYVESFQYAVLNPSGYAGYTGPTAADYAYITGYTIPSTSATPSAGSAKMLFGIRNVFLADTYEHVTSAAGDMYAEATFVPGGGTIEISEGSGFQFGQSDGTLSLSISSSGELSLSGTFAILSNRVAGQKPSDMASLQGEIVHFRGHLLGKNGDQIGGFGVVSGTMTDVAGTALPFQASAYLISCLRAG